MLNAASTQALAADFDWKKFNGTKVHLLLNKHPYADAMIADLDNFKALTGMDVTYDIFPEDVYFDKVTAALSSKSSQYDAFMTGAYMTWTYGPAGWVDDLNAYIKDPAKTNPKYAWDDVLPGLRASTAWNGVPGGALGSADAKQWCIPWGYELNSITYNRKMYDKAGVKPPKNLPDLVETAAKLTKDLGGPYGIGVRGSRSWATIHPGFLSGYANYGQKDLTVSADGKLKAAMNTAGVEGLSQAVRRNDPEFRAEELVDLHLVSGRHRSWRRRFGDDLRRRHPRLFHGRRRQQGEGQSRLPRLRGQSRRQGADAERLDLVAGDEFLRQAEGRRLVFHAMGVLDRTRHVRRAQDGLRQSRPRLGVRRTRRSRTRLNKSYSGYLEQYGGLGAGRENLLHAATVVLRRHHPMGGGAAEDGRQGSAGRRRARPARRGDRQAIEGRWPRLSGAASPDGGRRASIPARPRAARIASRLSKSAARCGAISLAIARAIACASPVMTL